MRLIDKSYYDYDFTPVAKPKPKKKKKQRTKEETAAMVANLFGFAPKVTYTAEELQGIAMKQKPSFV
jgi:hypothetical protein